MALSLSSHLLIQSFWNFLLSILISLTLWGEHFLKFWILIKKTKRVQRSMSLILFYVLERWCNSFEQYSEKTGVCMLSHSIVSNSMTPWPARLLCPWNFLGKSTEVGCHFLLQGIFLTQGSNPCLLHLLHWQTFFTTVPPGKPQKTG